MNRIGACGGCIENRVLGEGMMRRIRIRGGFCSRGVEESRDKGVQKIQRSPDRSISRKEQRKRKDIQIIKRNSVVQSNRSSEHKAAG